MLRPMILALLAGFLSTTCFAHCQVPCGIFDDQMRFQQLLEDETTIAKAQLAGNPLCGHVAAGLDQQIA